MKEEDHINAREGNQLHPIHLLHLIRQMYQEVERIELHVVHTDAACIQGVKLKSLKKEENNVTFITYDGSYGQTDKLLNFIQQFDAAFGGEDFTESSKLRHVSMYLQKFARKWWASLKTKGIQPRTWKVWCLEMMKQFLPSNVRDDVLTD